MKNAAEAAFFLVIKMDGSLLVSGPHLFYFLVLGLKIKALR
jgi:hypothetical protein